MMLDIKKYPALLWGVSLLFSVESMEVTVPEVSSPISTPQLMMTAETDTDLTSLNPETESESTFTPNNKATVTQIPPSRTQSYSLDSRGSTAGVVVKNTSITSSGQQRDLIATVPSASTTVPGAAQPSHTANISGTEKPTDGPLSPQSVMTSADLSTAASAVGPETAKPDITSTGSTRVSITTSGSSTITPSSTSGPESDPSSTPRPSSIAKTSTTNSDFLSTPQAISPTGPVSSSKVPYTGPSSTTESPPTSEAISTRSGISTSAISTSPSAGVLIPRVPSPSPSATTAVIRTESSSGAEVQPCPTTRCVGVVNQCLIAIASLAGISTIFIVTTIVLCTKLSTRKHRYRQSQQGTEMVCISALPPERNCIYGRHYNPKSNGALLPFIDSDEDGGDNLTLTSFLPENDHVI